ncbi:hypothetical protein PsAD2_02251 [Pseudovibrio axinellae]|uniref:N-acetyltransferase domain-containing protein n=1 Tax=Pseudovibrio axinellae TaxID=989403 RepID=A0A165YD81_9HYPH|nr:hypothetical protein [Pseudovibrio axinellae]KZL18736.1 hypothetical protein PsAD2_02251 [Pseudovibrio axinellae]SEP94701.1 hypothetical protein SAMN05421798_101790 [Pseudovibrio axinellae]
MPRLSVELLLVTPLFMREFFELLAKWGEQDTLSEPVLSLEETARRLLVDPSAGQAWLIRSGGKSLGFALVSYRFSVRSGGKVGFIEQVALAPIDGVEQFLPAILQELEDDLAQKSVVKMEVSLKRPGRKRRKRFFEEFGFLTQSVDLLEKVIPYNEEFPLNF